MTLTRTYNLALISNYTKLETARYTYERHLKLVNYWCGRLFFNGNRPESTKGMGGLANQARHKARGIISALFAAQKVTGEKINVPICQRIGCPAKLEKSKNSFDYWLTIENLWTKIKRVPLPVKSHKKLNQSLREGWELLNTAELFQDKNGKFYARVFVQKEGMKATPKQKSLGCDVGYRTSITRSDGYFGKNLSRVIRNTREKNSQRQRQGLLKASLKTAVKQFLDREAKRAADVAVRNGFNLVVENPKLLANLKSGKLQGWARSYFANRCHVLAAESEVFIWDVNPAYTSITCNKCGHKDVRNRSGVSFVCVKCEHSAHADLNAARNIARKGQEKINSINQSGSLNLEFRLLNENENPEAFLWTTITKTT
jgi:transposase